MLCDWGIVNKCFVVKWLSYMNIIVVIFLRLKCALQWVEVHPTMSQSAPYNELECTLQWVGVDPTMSWSGPYNELEWTLQWLGVHPTMSWSAPYNELEWTLHELEWTLQWVGVHSTMSWSVPYMSWSVSYNECKSQGSSALRAKSGRNNHRTKYSLRRLTHTRLWCTWTLSVNSLRS